MNEKPREDWLEEERRKALRLAPWAYSMLFIGYLNAFVPEVIRLWKSPNAIMFAAHAAACGMYSVVFPFMGRSLKTAIDSIRKPAH